MKMTRLEWRYLQRIALDHPYYDTHELPLSEKEAKAIVEANIRMTGREFVDSIYAKLGMTRPEEKKERFAWLRGIGELFTVPPIRKIAIAVLAVLLMTVFFAATPTGRAIAESVIHYIATLFDDGVVTVNRTDHEAIVKPVCWIPDSEEDKLQKQGNSEISVGSFEEFAAATGKQPVILLFPHTELEYYYDESVDYLRLRTEYETPKGTIVTSQIWNTEGLCASTLTGFTVYDADPSIYYSFENNGTMTVMKLYEDSIVGITAEDNCSVDDIIKLFSYK